MLVGFEKLISLISKTIDLSSAEKLIFESYFKVFDYEKNRILETENKKPEFLYFVVEGYLKLFYYDDQGDEVTTLFGFPNSFITPFLNFIHETVTNENLECITDCKVLRIERSKMVELIEKNENFKKISLIIFERAIANTHIRANDLATLSAEQRYLKLMEQQPEIVQNVPVQYIASYLGIKPQSLSRIRSKLV